MVSGFFISMGLLLDLFICLFLGCKFCGFDVIFLSLLFDIDLWVRCSLHFLDFM